MAGEPYYIGEIKMLTAKYPPAGWLLCDGRMLPIDQNQNLYGVIRTTYGGDGEKTFALPKLEPYQGINFYISMYGMYPSPA